MNNKMLLALSLTIFPVVSFGQGAQGYQCAIGDLQRRVEILYEAGGSVPCEVHYYKKAEAENERQVLWRALNEEGYCERKAREFVVKLEGMGWSCEEIESAVQESVTRTADNPELGAGDEPVDDTDALMPGEEPAPSDSQ